MQKFTVLVVRFDDQQQFYFRHLVEESLACEEGAGGRLDKGMRSINREKS